MELILSLAIVYSRARLGINAPLVTVEVHLSKGLPGFNIVGLPETSVKESRDRVRSSLVNSGFEFPAFRITVNLAPADLPKEGGRFDLPIAVGILAATGQIPVEILDRYEFCGELALSGEIRSVLGEIPTVLAAKESGRVCVLPKDSARIGALIPDVLILGVETLIQVFKHLANIEVCSYLSAPSHRSFNVRHSQDMQDVVGQVTAKRVLEIAAAGQHNLLFLGPAGTGKSMLAQRMVTILPEMSEQEALDVAAVHSVCGHTINPDTWLTRPFRSPHHTCSAVALVGGSSNPRPGEISLAHNGILFLDELPEFERKVLDVLREPLETGRITISRAASQADFPANFQLVAAMNPSPTGHYEDGRASKDSIMRYLNRLSGPFLDRIDLQLEVPRLPKGALTDIEPDRGDSSEVVRSRVIIARERQLNRAGKPNGLMTSREIDMHCKLSRENSDFLENAVEKLSLSARAFHKLLKVARTIADLQESDHIQREHLAEAMGYRAMDRLINRIRQSP